MFHHLSLAITAFCLKPKMPYSEGSFGNLIKYFFRRCNLITTSPTFKTWTSKISGGTQNPDINSLTETTTPTKRQSFPFTPNQQSLFSSPLLESFQKSPKITSFYDSHYLQASLRRRRRKPPSLYVVRLLP